MQICYVGRGGLTKAATQLWCAVVLWSNQFDAAAEVEDAGWRRRRQGSGLLGRREEEDKDEGAGWKNEKNDPLSLFIRRWIKGMRGNRGGRKMIMWLHERLNFREVH